MPLRPAFVQKVSNRDHNNIAVKSVMALLSILVSVMRVLGPQGPGDSVEVSLNQGMWNMCD